jgi:hypothetical protein
MKRWLCVLLLIGLGLSSGIARAGDMQWYSTDLPVAGLTLGYSSGLWDVTLPVDFGMSFSATDQVDLDFTFGSGTAGAYREWGSFFGDMSAGVGGWDQHFYGDNYPPVGSWELWFPDGVGLDGRTSVHFSFCPMGMGDIVTWPDVTFSSASLNVFAEAAPVPEPSSLLVLGAGILGLAGIIRKKHG